MSENAFRSTGFLLRLQLVSIIGEIQKLFLMAILLCALPSCSGHRDIVGKWRSADANAIVWEFAPNGTVLIGVDQGRYSFGDQNRVKIQTRFSSSVYQMEFSGDKLILRSPKGSNLELTRIK
jgi:hypothetical protein